MRSLETRQQVTKFAREAPAVIDSAGAACPVCLQRLEQDTGWAIRRAGRWFRFRSQQCLDKFERHPGAYSAVDGDERGAADPSPCTEWACY